MAVMVVLSVIPRTRTFSPLVTALAEAVLVPFSYAVLDVSWTVTFWPADVVRVKPDVVTLLTVPVDPPAAGPDRALDAPPDRGPLAGRLPLVAEVLLVEALLEAALTIP
ncbi:MAG: hypothetical protein ACLPKI_18300 [Streptosporangiaceae bacterium]